MNYGTNIPQSASGISWSGEAGTSSAIDSALHTLAGNIEGLHDSLTSTERVLSPIMLPEAPTGCEAKGGLTAVLCESELLIRINALTARVIAANNRISSIIQRSQV